VRYLILSGAVLMAVLSLGARIGVAAHLILLVPAVVMIWFMEVTWRPLRPCKHCDKGRNWDKARQNFGEHCGYCGTTGKKLRPAALAIRILGGGHLLRNLPDQMRSRDG